MARKHKEFDAEAAHLSDTLNRVREALDKSKLIQNRLEKDTAFRKRHLSSESSEDYVRLIVNTTLQSGLDIKVRNLAYAINKPYFARMDFREYGRTEAEKLYIGKVSLMREEDQAMVIVDWRAPVANLWYDGRLGDASYECPGGLLSGELLLKRQFAVDEGRLEAIFDVDVASNDELLTSSLGANADNRLKEIVSTIQADQNKVIRADMWQPLVVQGSAGSGKTTIALHRIAYLVYTYDKTFHPENFMIIAPNRLFLDYISDVLPELGVERVKQTTFEEFAAGLVGKIKIADGASRMRLYVNARTPEERRDATDGFRIAAFKSSRAYLEAMEKYMEWIEAVYLPGEDLAVEGLTIYPASELKVLFTQGYKMFPFHVRLAEIEKHIKGRVKQRRERFFRMIDARCDLDLEKIKSRYPEGEQRQQLVLKAFDLRDERMKRFDDGVKVAVKDWIRQITAVTPVDWYRRLFEDPTLFRQFLGGMETDALDMRLREETLANLKKNTLDVEDVAPVLYIKLRLYGLDEKIPVRHVVFDEAQDFSPFQIMVMARYIKDSSFTILGDINQGIHAYRGTNDWQDVLDAAFGDRQPEVLQLPRSYRSTVEIMGLAASVIGQTRAGTLYPMEPVIRHGTPPDFICTDSDKAMIDDVVARIRSSQGRNLKTFALIPKGESRAEELYVLLKKKIKDASLLTGKEKSYKAGVVVVPSYLSKGLEFDEVFIADADNDTYAPDSEVDARLLYVTLTRPLHRLTVYWQGEKTGWLPRG